MAWRRRNRRAAAAAGCALLLLLLLRPSSGAAPQMDFASCQQGDKAFNYKSKSTATPQESGSPCPDLRAVVQTGGDLLCACGTDGAVLCYGDGDPKPQTPTRCKPVKDRMLGCTGAKAKIQDVALSPDEKYIYAACNWKDGSSVVHCSWDPLQDPPRVTGCRVVQDASCPQSSKALDGVTGVYAIYDSLILSCYSDNDTISAGVRACPLSTAAPGTLAGACEKRGIDPCGSKPQRTGSRNSQIWLDGVGGMTVGCDHDGYVYCDYTLAAGPSNCDIRAGLSPCPQWTTGISVLQSGAAAVGCASDGYRWCGPAPTASPSAPPTAAPVAAPECIKVQPVTAAFSNKATSASCDAAKCIDGQQVSQDNCFSPNSTICGSEVDADVWLRLDFPATVSVCHVNITNPRFNPARLGVHEVWIGDSSAAPMAVGNTLGSSDTYTLAGVAGHSIQPPIGGRHVFLKLPGPGRSFELAEVEVFAVPYPSAGPSLPPAAAPTPLPSSAPNAAPSLAPTAQPTSVPSPPPSGSPAQPTAVPTLPPAPTPSRAPSAPPRPAPSAPPSPAPSRAPSAAPSPAPSAPPSAPPKQPSSAPSAPPAPPSAVPTTSPADPSAAPSVSPTAGPSPAPSPQPSALPSPAPSAVPSAPPSPAPSAAPTTMFPTLVPTAAPTGRPSTAPSPPPSARPSRNPSAPPALPSAAPSQLPSASPAQPPSSGPSASPTRTPSRPPRSAPSAAPAFAPSAAPSLLPSGTTGRPSTPPSAHPCSAPTARPVPAPPRDAQSIPAAEEALFGGVTVASVVDVPSPGMTGAALVAATHCPERPGHPVDMSIALHPLGFKLNDDIFLGALLGNQLIVAASCALGGLAVALAHAISGRLVRRNAVQLKAMVRLPGGLLLPPSLLFQGSTYALFRTAIKPPDGGVLVWVLIVLGAVSCCATPFAVSRFVTSRVGDNAAYVGDIKTPRWLVYIIGPGEWVSTTKEMWYARYGNVLKPYKPLTAARACNAQFAENALISLLSAVMGTVSSGSTECSIFNFAVALIFLLHGAWSLRVIPYARPRDLVHEGILTVTLATAMVCKGVGFSNDADGFFEAANALVACAAVAIAGKLTLDVVSWLYVRMTGRIRRLQGARIAPPAPLPGMLEHSVELLEVPTQTPLLPAATTTEDGNPSLSQRALTGDTLAHSSFSGSVPVRDSLYGGSVASTLPHRHRHQAGDVESPSGGGSTKARRRQHQVTDKEMTFSSVSAVGATSSQHSDWPAGVLVTPSSARHRARGRMREHLSQESGMSESGRRRTRHRTAEIESPTNTGAAGRATTMGSPRAARSSRTWENLAGTMPSTGARTGPRRIFHTSSLYDVDGISDQSV